MQIQTISKSDWITTLSDGHKLVLDNKSVVLIDVDLDEIEKIEILDNKLIITLLNGEVVTVDNFDVSQSDLVIRNGFVAQRFEMQSAPN